MSGPPGRVWDLVVAGGGPVGLVTAIEARRHGMSVLVVEPRGTPVDKACGEGLMPSAVARLRELGISPSGRAFEGIRYVGADREVAARFRAGPGLGVRRTTLQRTLSDAADRSGVCREVGRVVGVRQDGSTVTAGDLRSRWLVAADGLHSPVRRELGLDAPPTASRPRYGLRRHFAVAPWSDHVEVHWSATVEGYVTPVAEDLVGVAVLGPPGASYDDAVVGLPALAARLRRAEPVTAVRGAGPLRQVATSVRSGRVLLVGDAAGYLDALTGEGLATGFASARAAVAALAADRPETYPAAWARATRRSRLLTGALLTATGRPRLRSALVPAAAAMPRLFSRTVDLLA